ncbi:MAG TPA: metalloregulator ArsR/SmtB family transcription factor [Steroidobacteraceae bacterium]|nr:metalloregulator ArsR/SmtB family transcription factor [Steroidobacteraceae bacterium]
MEPVESSRMIRWLRAAGEPTRLRLLALCAQGSFSVTALAEAVRQSEPRVCRHLKILSEAGLVERCRNGQWVEYRLAPQPEASGFAAGLLGQLDRRDVQLQRDRAGAHRAQGGEGAQRVRESRLGRALAQLVDADESVGRVDSALILGATHLELLTSVARRARTFTTLAHGRRAVQAVRAYAERHGLGGTVRDSVAPGNLVTQDLERAGAPFALILLDRPRAAAEELAHVLGLAAAALRPGGRLWVFEGYEMLEHSGQRVIEHPLARLRRLLREAGFSCERLSPLESDGEHVLAVAAHVGLASRSAAAERA